LRSSTRTTDAGLRDPALPGVLAYGATPDEASTRAEILALRGLAERLEHGVAKPVEISISLAAA
jgi:predicted RNase H-like HicB family nuclease